MNLALATILPLLQGEGGGEEAPPGGGFPWVPMILILGIFYVVLILPERKKQKQRQAMLGAMKKGDKVMTSSGMYGQVVAMADDVVTLQVADGVRLKFNRAAIQQVLETQGAGSPDAAKDKEEVAG